MKIGEIDLCISEYKEYHTERFDMYLSGDIYNLDDKESLEPGGEAKYLESIAKAITNQEADFERIYGYYRLFIVDKEISSQYFFSDNLGSQRFYMNENTISVSDSFLSLMKGIGVDKIDRNAIAQLFAWGTIADGKTIAKGITKTDSDYYYEIKDKTIIKHSKGLKRFCDKYTGHNLYDFVAAECRVNKGNLIGARVTGGNDSRAILASILKSGNKPETIITGHAGNPDIPISKKIADIAGVDLVILDSDEHENGWIEKSYDFFDGCFDPVLAYRQLQTVRSLKAGTRLLFGGVGGEFYKNYYINPFRDKIIFQKASVRDVVNKVFGHNTGCYAWLSDSILQQTKGLEKQILELFQDKLEVEDDQLALFNHAGFYRLRSTFSDITNSITRDMIQADPLVDPRLIRSIADKNPFFLAMAIWQRRQIHRDYPALSEIETDQGYSMTVNPIKLTYERIKKGFFWASRVTARVRRTLGLKWKDITQNYWDVDYAAARQTDAWLKCFQICKDYEILSKKAKEDDIPLACTGIIILLGMNIEGMKNGA
ncbi:hypothetical protein [Butyrivibrio sp. CB08]|uniref:hypothetical protein n=1 Tax=Butyrivibrio sp. CB08 TaxID=2364879 RepID=UPI000EA9C76C|nr:hypothetical protein [Butyrivibrio sp. CB08]